MANIQDMETHFTFYSAVGDIEGSFFYLPHWYNGNYVLVTLVQGVVPSGNGPWLEYLGKRGIVHEMLGSACLVLPESVEQLFLDEKTFTGNCEIYVCNKKPSSDAVPDKSYLPAQAKFDIDMPAGFLEGLRGLDALAYMSEGGAGGGVNIAHKAKEEIIYYVMEMKM